jgi:anaerobic ribonucleoside-triphosphate reductase activating protein
MRHPEPHEWLSAKVSQRHVADYKAFMFVDGEGVRCSLYVSGCLFACDGCFNRSTWNFRYGTPYTAELEDRIIADVAQPWVQGLTLLGGEPFLNTGVCLALTRRVHAEFGESKDIWCWTGYTYEQVLVDSDDKVELLREIDILVDGPFEIARRDSRLQFRGSSNQRIIDVKQSLATGRTTPWANRIDGVHDFEPVGKQALI